MLQFDGSIYKIPRVASGFTQEQVAECLDYSVSAIQAFEAGDRLPPNAVVAKMAELFDAPNLPIQHLRQDTMGRNVLPDVQVKGLAAAALALFNRIDDFPKIRRTLQDIAEDNQVSEDEKTEWEQTKRYLWEFVKAAMEVLYSDAD